MSRYIDELIDMYERGEISGDDVCDNITRLTEAEEYQKIINQNRIKDKLHRKYEFIRYGKSPLDILIEWEEKEKILHFLDWIRKILTEEEWNVFIEYVVHKKSMIKMGEEKNVDRVSIWLKLDKIMHTIQSALPLYYEQFGDIHEYLKE